MAERRFDSREIKSILRRADAMRAGEGSANSSGLTLSQIQVAASELGISPDLVAKAAHEVALVPAADGFWSFFWGGPSVVSRSVDIEGRLAPQSRPAVLQEIRDVTGLVGKGALEGDSFEFYSANEDGSSSLHVAITPMGETSRLSVRGCFADAYANYLFTMVPGVPFMVFLSKVLKSGHVTHLNQVGLVALLMAVIATFLGARSLVKRSIRRRSAKVSDLIDRLTDRIEHPSNLVKGLRSHQSVTGETDNLAAQARSG